MKLSTDEIKKLDHDHVLGTFARTPIALVKGEGMYVWDADGKRYLDFLSGIAVNCLGHCHPAVVKAVQEQAATLLHVSNIFYTQPQPLLAQKLVALSGFEKAFFANSGAEANEAAIKIARKYGKKDGKQNKFYILAAQQSFHGRTLATVTMTGQEKYQKPFTPLPNGFRYVPLNDAQALADAMSDEICAVMLEPIQGESGIHPASADYLQAARKLCDQHGALLIFDEIQTGVGRTGEWFAYQHSGVMPDLMTLAKGLGSGFPVGACLARGEAAHTLVPGDHGTTFGGNPLACATALAVLETLDKEKLCAHAKEIGFYFMDKLRGTLAPCIKEVRGMGLMIGVELNKAIAKQVTQEALEHGLIVNAIGETTLRLVPALIVEKTHIDDAVKTLRDVLSKLA